MLFNMDLAEVELRVMALQRAGSKAAMPSFTLQRLNAIERTVRYEWLNTNGYTLYSPAFHATLQEWERARD